MTFVIVPHEIGATTVTLWIGAICEGDLPDRPVQLGLNGELRPAGDNWRVWQTFASTDPGGYASADRLLHEPIEQDELIVERIYFQRAEWEGLTPTASIMPTCS